MRGGSGQQPCGLARLDAWRGSVLAAMAAWALLCATSAAEEDRRLLLAQSSPSTAVPAAPNPFPPPVASAPAAKAPAKSARPKAPPPLPPQAAPAPPMPSTPIPTNAPAPSLISPPDQPQPVVHAKNANIGPCVGAVEKGVAGTIEAPHSAYSLWNQADPKSHAFTSIVAQAYPTPSGPRSASVIVAAPAASGCDSVTVQVYPVARSCPEIEREMLQQARPVASIAGLTVIERGKYRNLLIPTAGNGCVLVGTAIEYWPPVTPDPPPNGR